MEMINENSEQYLYAKKRVKSLKGFYTHLTVYIIVNIFLLIIQYKNLENNESFFSFEVFSTALFWGIGLLAHGISVFGKNMIFNKDWEDKKIQEFMSDAKKSRWE